VKLTRKRNVSRNSITITITCGRINKVSFSSEKGENRWNQTERKGGKKQKKGKMNVPMCSASTRKVFHMILLEASMRAII